MKLTLLLTFLFAVGSSACTSDDECSALNGFCGRDGNCTTFSCQNWFEQGPVEFTGYDPADPVELSCSDYSNGPNDWTNSIVYGCRPYSPGKKAPESKSWAYFFNQMCTAGDFTCYQNRPGSDAEYQEFVGQAARINIPSCDNLEGYDNKLPLYWYLKEAHIVDEEGNLVETWGQGREETESSSSLNPNEAEATFFSRIVVTDAARDAVGDTLADSAGTSFGKVALSTVMASAMVVLAL